MNYEPLADVAKVIMGQSPPSSTYNTVGEGLPFYQGKTDFGDMYPTPRVYCTEPSRIAEAGDILISVRAPVGPTNISREKSAIGRGLSVIRVGEKLDRDFLLYFLRFYEPELAKAGTGSTFAAIAREDLETIKIPLPPLTEQKRIASLLARADRLRHLRRRARELGESLLQSVFLEMFGNPVTNEKGFDIFYLAELCEPTNGIKAGPFGSSLKKEIYTKSGYRIYGQEQVIGGSFSIGDYYISKEMFEKDFRPYEVKPNDILISLVGTFGKTIIVPEGIEPGIINPRLLKISPRKDKLNSVFLSEYLQLSSVQKQLADLSHGGTMGILNAGQLKEFKVICPPLNLQEEFAGVVARVESLRGRMSEAERQAEGLFQSLLAESFA